MTTRWLKIGKVGKAHGLRGAFFVRDREDPIPKAYKELVIGDEPLEAHKMRIQASHYQGTYPVLTVAGVDTREKVEPLIGKPIWVDIETVRTEAKKQNRVLIADLVGRDVVDAGGERLGVVAEVYNVGASDIMVITRDKRRLELPLVATYVNLLFDRDGVVELIVPATTFEDLWENE